MIMLLRTMLLEKDVEKSVNMPDEICAELLRQFSAGVFSQRFSVDPLWEPLHAATIDGWCVETHNLAVKLVVELAPAWEQVTPNVGTLEELLARLIKERGWHKINTS